MLHPAGRTATKHRRAQGLCGGALEAEVDVVPVVQLVDINCRCAALGKSDGA